MNYKKRFFPDYYYYENYSLSKKIECIIEELETHCEFCKDYVNKDIHETCPYCGISETKKKLKDIKEKINNETM